MFTFHFSVTYDANGDKKPNLKFYVLCNDKVVRGETLAGWSRPDNPIEQLPHIGNQYNKEIISSFYTEFYKFKIDIDESIENDYTLVIEHTNGVYPDDYLKSNFGIRCRFM